MKNIFKSSEFALGMAALSKVPLAGQPNATESGAWKSADALQEMGQGLAQQEALKKARKEAKKQKKRALGEAFGPIGALITGGDVAQGFVNNISQATSMLAGGMVGGPGGKVLSALRDPVGSIAQAGANKLGDLVLKGTTAPQSLMDQQVNGMLRNAQGHSNLNGPKFDPSGTFAESMKTGTTVSNKVTKPLRYKLGNALKRAGSGQSLADINRMPAEPDGSYTFHP